MMRLLVCVLLSDMDRRCGRFGHIRVLSPKIPEVSRGQSGGGEEKLVPIGL